jgi:hypothetical protein
MKIIIILLGLLLGAQAIVWGQGGAKQATINWSAIDEDRESALLVELKNMDNRDAMVKLRTELQNIAQARNVGIIIADNKLKQFVLAVSSQDPAVVDQVRNEIKRKMEGSEIIFLQKTFAELKAEYRRE